MAGYDNITTKDLKDFSNTTLNDTILQPINYTTNDEDVYVVTRIQLHKHMNCDLSIIIRYD